MIIQVIHPETKEVIDIEIGAINKEKLQSSCKVETPEKAIFSAIGNLDLPAEAKALLIKIKDFSIMVGGAVIEIGKKILELIVYAVKKFPSTAIGIVVGSVIGMTLSSIPFLGWALGWLLTPLCIALGLTLGFWKDITSVDVKASVSAAIDQIFSTMKDIPVPRNA